jgi:hypothetical protein
MEGDVARGSISSDGQWFMGRRREPSSPTPPPAASSETVALTANELDFIKISKDIYLNSMNEEGLDKCWERNPSAEVEAGAFGGKDHIAIYTCKCKRCQNHCALAFSGSNDLTDWANNLARGLAQRTFCGLEGIHDGFVEELEGVSDHAFWRDSVLPMLRSPECSTVNAVGHSLGGAMAAIFAACVNCPTCEKPEALEGIDSEVALWTTGAPQVSMEPLTNGRSSDGTFKGKRFWNFHDRDYWLFKSKDVDLVPSAPGIIGYKHPKMESVGLDMDQDKDIDTRADDADEALIPFGLPFRWDIGYHMTGNYTENAAAHNSGDGAVNQKGKGRKVRAGASLTAVSNGRAARRERHAAAPENTEGRVVRPAMPDSASRGLPLA